MKSIEEIKEEVARDYSYDSYNEFKDLTRKTDTDHIFIMDGIVNKVAQQYAQQYANEVENLNDTLNIRQSRMIALEQGNKELVEMLRQVVYEYEQGEQSFKTILEIKELLNKQS